MFFVLVDFSTLMFCFEAYFALFYFFVFFRIYAYFIMYSVLHVQSRY